MSVFHPARALLPREQRSLEERPPVACIAEAIFENAVVKTVIGRQGVTASENTTQNRKRVAIYRVTSWSRNGRYHGRVVDVQIVMKANGKNIHYGISSSRRPWARRSKQRLKR